MSLRVLCFFRWFGIPIDFYVTACYNAFMTSCVSGVEDALTCRYRDIKKQERDHL